MSLDLSTVSAVRRRWYAAPGRQRRLREPVVSVGNLSHGGRGKTPLVGLLARLLIEAGERPAILTRGYGRRQSDEGVVVVSDGVHLLADVDRAGDEPLMLARAVPGACVLVSAQRALAGAVAERLFGATVHILDDGFQHLALARDLDLVLVSPDDLADRPVPFGRLREPIAALGAADALIVDGPDDLAVLQRLGPAAPAPRFQLRRAAGAPLPLEPGRSWAAPDRRIVAVAGIARPHRFVDTLSAAGWTVHELVVFGDHHAYTTADLASIRSAAERAGAPVATTAKDAVRLLPFRPLPVPIAVVPLAVSVEPAGAFREWLVERLAAAREIERGAEQFDRM